MNNYLDDPWYFIVMFPCSLHRLIWKQHFHLPQTIIYTPTFIQCRYFRTWHIIPLNIIGPSFLFLYNLQVPWHVPCGGVPYGDGNLVFIANDWHTALLPVYLKAYYRDHGLMQYTRSVLVIHNIAHQVLFSSS